MAAQGHSKRRKVTANEDSDPENSLNSQSEKINNGTEAESTARRTWPTRHFSIILKGQIASLARSSEFEFLKEQMQWNGEEFDFGNDRFQKLSNKEYIHRLPRNQYSTGTNIFRVVSVRRDPINDFDEYEKNDEDTMKKCKYCPRVYRGRTCFKKCHRHVQKAHGGKAGKKSRN